MKELPEIGQTVVVKVNRVISGGLFVEVIGGDAAGVIRVREIPSVVSTDPNDWKVRYKPNTELEAKVIDHRDDGRLELSIKQVGKDPWQDISYLLPAGILVDGTVSNVRPYGVFVDLSLGVTGLLHISRIPVRIGAAPAELFWIGDRVKVIVDAVDESQRRISLTMKGLKEARWDHLKNPNLVTMARLREQSEYPKELLDIGESSIELLLQQPSRRILIVEDEPAHREAITDWLRRAGQYPHAVGSGEEALDAMADFHPDIALVDLWLPGINGADTIRRLIDIQPELRAVMMTADYEATVDDLELKGIKLLLKPLRAAELLDVLCSTSPDSEELTQEILPIAPIRIDPQHAESPSKHGILKILASLLQQTRATKAIIFTLDTARSRVGILAQVGQGHLETQALYDLIRSPVRIVAEKNVTVRTNNVQNKDHARYFRHLTSLVSFESCIGVPVNANIPGRTALFIFHKLPRAFSEVDEAFAIASSYSVTAILERQMFMRQSGDMQRLALLGQLSRTLIHEVNHRLSPVDFALDTLQVQFRDIDRMIRALSGATDQNSLSIEQEFSLVCQSLDQLTKATQGLIQAAKLFGQMAKTDSQSTVVVLSDLVTETAFVMKDVAQKYHVRIIVDPPYRFIATRTNVTLVRQILLNVILNAIQQIALHRPEGGGLIRVSIGDTRHGDEHMVFIHVEDNGPGIHRRLWEQIFELGYTTRNDGSGLGLHISRGLAESLGGRIYVMDSFLSWGTVFSIELPPKL